MAPLTGRRTFLKNAAAATLGALCSPWFSVAKASPGPAIERAALTMGSIVTFTLYHDDEREADAAIGEAIREMKTVDTLMSVFNPASQLSQVNAGAAGRAIAVDERIIEVCLTAERIAAETNGAFDPTVEPLMELYGFRDDAGGRFPTDAQIARTLDAVGIRHVLVDRRDRAVAFDRAGTKLDFGGIAVGYAIDRAVAILRSRGITSALINHSGDIFAIGCPPDAPDWLIGIRNPVRRDEIIATIPIRDQALCTSGNYENFVEANGCTIGHILDPSTGRDAARLLSATAVAPAAVEADALSTALFVLGEAGSRKVLGGRTGVSGLLVPDGSGATVTLQ